MTPDSINTDVLIVGGGTGGTAAAIQAARRGVRTVLVSEFAWLGGMLTAAGVAAPDGNELLAWQTGLWGAWLRALQHRQTGGLDHAWVSFFTYEPQVGAAIWADWVRALPNLHWIAGQVPREVLRQGDRIRGVRFDEVTVYATITIDGTELGDLLALGSVPYRWGWETQAVFAEPSAPVSLTDPQDPLHPIVQRYPVQSPTWVVLMQDVGEGQTAPPITPTDTYDPSLFAGAWDHYGGDRFLTYGQLPQRQFMINWPHCGNDYGRDLQDLTAGATAWRQWAEAAIAHSQNFAYYIQAELGDRYGLATHAFPTDPRSPGGGAFALQPYYRESRRVVGLQTVTETDILPLSGGQVAPLPVNDRGEMSAIAIGNYPNDHHYPGFAMPLQPKSLRWGGRWTGTPFTLPYEALIPATVDGLLVSDKNLSVSHIANGATRLQPVVLAIGQAAGMAAALCVQQGCQPRDLDVRTLQLALLEEPTAPAAILPLFNGIPSDEDWLVTQRQLLDDPARYPLSGHLPRFKEPQRTSAIASPGAAVWEGTLQGYTEGPAWCGQMQLPDGRCLDLVTLDPLVNQQLAALSPTASLRLKGIPNWAAGWLRVIEIT